jgi:uncharacterized protein
MERIKSELRDGMLIEWDVQLSNMKHPMRGCGPFLHDNPRDRPGDIFGGKTTLHIGPDRSGYVLLPIIPEKGRVR